MTMNTSLTNANLTNAAPRRYRQMPRRFRLHNPNIAAIHKTAAKHLHLGRRVFLTHYVMPLDLLLEHSSPLVDKGEKMLIVLFMD